MLPGTVHMLTKGGNPDYVVYISPPSNPQKSAFYFKYSQIHHLPEIKVRRSEGWGKSIGFIFEMDFPQISNKDTLRKTLRERERAKSGTERQT